MSQQDNKTDDDQKQNNDPNVGSLNVKLSFKITDNGQDDIKKSGYYFDENGICLSLSTNQRPTKFAEFEQFETFGAIIEKYIFYILVNQFKLNAIKINSLDIKNKNKKKKKKKKKKSTIMVKLYAPKISENLIEQCTIFMSPQYQSNSTLLLLLTGSGSVRAGQWSRSICINDCLAAGTMFPFVSKAISNNWSVMICDPNGRMDNNKREYSDIHLLFIYDNYIKPYLFKKDQVPNNNNDNDNNMITKPVVKGIKSIFIVCHSAGGIATTRLLNERKSILPYIAGCAGTDTDFGRPKSDEAKEVFKNKVVNFRASYQPKGTVLSDIDEFPKRIAAGHHQHQYSNASAIDLIFSYFASNI